METHDTMAGLSYDMPPSTLSFLLIVLPFALAIAILPGLLGRLYAVFTGKSSSPRLDTQQDQETVQLALEQGLKKILNSEAFPKLLSTVIESELAPIKEKLEELAILDQIDENIDEITMKLALHTSDMGAYEKAAEARVQDVAQNITAITLQLTALANRVHDLQTGLEGKDDATWRTNQSTQLEAIIEKIKLMDQLIAVPEDVKNMLDQLENIPARIATQSSTHLESLSTQLDTITSTLVQLSSNIDKSEASQLLSDHVQNIKTVVDAVSQNLDQHHQKMETGLNKLDETLAKSSTDSWREELVKSLESSNAAHATTVDDIKKHSASTTESLGQVQEALESLKFQINESKDKHDDAAEIRAGIESSNKSHAEHTKELSEIKSSIPTAVDLSNLEKDIKSLLSNVAEYAKDVTANNSSEALDNVRSSLSASEKLLRELKDDQTSQETITALTAIQSDVSATASKLDELKSDKIDEQLSAVKSVLDDVESKVSVAVSKLDGMDSNAISDQLRDIKATIGQAGEAVANPEVVLKLDELALQFKTNDLSPDVSKILDNVQQMQKLLDTGVTLSTEQIEQLEKAIKENAAIEAAHFVEDEAETHDSGVVSANEEETKELQTNGTNGIKSKSKKQKAKKKSQQKQQDEATADATAAHNSGEQEASEAA